VKVLISPSDEKEAVEAIAGGADIIDVKNPREGALGANFPWVIKRIREIAPPHVEVSCTLGDIPNLPGAMSLAAVGAATTGVDYVKAGLYGLKTKDDAVYLMKNIGRAIRDFDSSIKVAATGYADAARIGSVNPLLVPEIAYEAEVDIAMVDTAVKDDKNLFSFLTAKQLASFVEKAHVYGLEVALAGSLRKEHLPMVYSLGAEVVGLRGAACTYGDRVNGRITKEKVRELVEIARHLKKQVELET
jgi:uncharacterized protein (UPF0264 family)